MLNLIPAPSQLWIATHSTGFVRKAMEFNKLNKSVAFLDFSERDFDQTVEMNPVTPNQHFFRKMYEVLQDDLAGLVAPSHIILCEGKKYKGGTDAKIYNAIFGESYPDALFISRGGSGEVEKSDLASVLEAIVSNVRVWGLIDRDEMTDTIRDEKIKSGIHVLRRRELENYLWDDEVIRTALQSLGANDDTIDDVLAAYPFPSPESDDVKESDHRQNLFQAIRGAAIVSHPGNNRKEFALEYLAPALRNTPSVYQELLEDVFPGDLR